MVLTNRKQFLKKYKLKDRGYSIDELSKISGIKQSILSQVYSRGIGAYYTQPQSVRMKGTYLKNINAPMRFKLSPQQWAMSRVYSFLNKYDTDKLNHDTDLR
jgi:hypothetical protein